MEFNVLPIHAISHKRPTPQIGHLRKSQHYSTGQSGKTFLRDHPMERTHKQVRDKVRTLEKQYKRDRDV